MGIDEHEQKNDYVNEDVDVEEANNINNFNSTKIMEETNKNIGKKVIIRANRAGVFFGTLKDKQYTPAGVEVKLENSRRIWYWKGAASLSQMATEGVKDPESCKFSVVVPSHIVEQVIEIIPCSDEAIKSIENVRVWRNH